MSGVSRETGFPARLIVIGTGTEVGKTHVSLALLGALARLGIQAIGLKPVESGVGAGTADHEKLRAASAFHVKQSPYLFADPVSPHLAARRAGQTIELDRVVSWVAAHPSPSVVETAGGLMTPLGPTDANLDLVRALLPARVLLVAQDRLGVLHEVACCRAVLGASHQPDLAVALVTPIAADASTGTNQAELRTLGLARAIIFPRAEPESPESLAAADRLIELLASS